MDERRAVEGRYGESLRWRLEKWATKMSAELRRLEQKTELGQKRLSRCADRAEVYDNQ